MGLLRALAAMTLGLSSEWRHSLVVCKRVRLLRILFVDEKAWFLEPFVTAKSPIGHIWINISVVDKSISKPGLLHSIGHVGLFVLLLSLRVMVGIWVNISLRHSILNLGVFRSPVFFGYFYKLSFLLGVEIRIVHVEWIILKSFAFRTVATFGLN